MVRVDRQTGKRIYAGWPGDSQEGSVIWEAFAAETEPKRSIRREELAARSPTNQPKAAAVTRKVNSGNQQTNSGAAQGPTVNKRDSDFLQQEGGIY